MTLLAAGAEAQEGSTATLNVDSLDLAAFDPSTLDSASLASTDALALVERLHQNGNHAAALAVLGGEIAELSREPQRNLAMLARLCWGAAEAWRLLRRFEEASALLADSERWLDALVSGLDATLPANRPTLDWVEIMRCTQVGLRGWIQQDWGALDAALASFEEERRRIEALPAGDGVARVRADSDKHLAVHAALTGAPESIDRLLRDRPEGTYDPFGMRPFLQLRLAFAWRERARREGTSSDRARAGLDAALAQSLAPIDRVFGELLLADVALDEGSVDEARELWRSAEAWLDELGAHDSRARRTWIGVGARVARAGSVDERRASRAAVLQEIDAFLAEWRALDSREGGYGLLHLDDSLRLLCELTELSLALDGAEAGARVAFEVLNRAHAETSLARRLGAGVPSLEELRRALCWRADDGVLVYLAGPTRSWAFALDRSSLRAVPVADLYAVERPRRRLVQELLAHDGAWSVAAREAAAELATLLLPVELRPWLEARSALTVCGLDLFLGEVPFEALDLGDGRRVGAAWAVSNLPPLAATAELARRAARTPPAAPGLRLLAAPAVAPDLAAELGIPAFTLEPAELDGILGAFPAESSELMLGTNAHAGALAGTPRSVLQLLVHGRFDERRSRGAELVLASSGVGDDGLLSAAGVERLFGVGTAPHLVVLTACRAARATQRRGDAGANDLVGAFLECGVQAVVASHFELDLAMACRTSEELYRALARGAELGEALRRARAELAQDPSFSDSAQPFLLRAVGLPPAFEPWAFSEERRARFWPVAAWATGAIALALLARRLSRRKARLRGSTKEEAEVLPTSDRRIRPAPGRRSPPQDRS